MFISTHTHFAPWCSTLVGHQLQMKADLQWALAVGEMVVGPPLGNGLAAAPAQQGAAAAAGDLVAVLRVGQYGLGQGG